MVQSSSLLSLHKFTSLLFLNWSRIENCCLNQRTLSTTLLFLKYSSKFSERCTYYSEFCSGLPILERVCMSACSFPVCVSVCLNVWIWHITVQFRSSTFSCLGWELQSFMFSTFSSHRAVDWWVSLAGRLFQVFHQEKINLGMCVNVWNIY